MLGLQGKVVLVTGGSRGIGRAICKAFAEQGCKVIINYHSNQEAAESILNEIVAMGQEAEIIQADISQSDQVKSMVSQIRKTYNRIDILVNNAGITKDNLLAMMSVKQWQDVIDTNLNGIFYCTKHVLKAMVGKKSGIIINMTSLSGVAGQEGQTNYSASKGGIISLTKSLAREVAKYGIRVNAIAPGLIETEMLEKIPIEILEHHKKMIPLKRLGRPEEIAKVALFLASDMSSYMTGQILNINGGEYM